jgi:hypothetical protein
LFCSQRGIVIAEKYTTRCVAAQLTHPSDLRRTISPYAADRPRD